MVSGYYRVKVFTDTNAKSTGPVLVLPKNAGISKRAFNPVKKSHRQTVVKLADC